MKSLEGYLCKSITGKKNIDEKGLVITNKERLKRSYYGILDRFSAEVDRRFTANDLMLNSLESFDIASEKFMDIPNLEMFDNCYTANHIA